MRIVAHLFDTYETATEVARALESAGFAHDSVSVVANQASASDPATTDGKITDEETYASTAAGTGASVGTLIGGGAGLLAGIGALAIPGVGPVVAAGWLVATLTGAGAGAGLGGLIGALTSSGVKHEHAHVYAEGVRRGGTLVTVRADEERATSAEAIMQGFQPVDITSREATYRADDGWTEFDESRGALTPEELRAERLRTIPPAI